MLQKWERDYWVRKCKEYGITGIKTADIVADEDGEYNCIGDMIKKYRWLWPGMHTWPNADCGAYPTPQTFHKFMKRHGYEKIEQPTRYSKAYDYAALYIDPRTQMISHGVRREGAYWISKCGREATVRYKRLAQMTGCYGTAVYFYKRLKASI